MPLPAFSQGVGGHITPPSEKPQPTQPAKKPRKRQDQPVTLSRPQDQYDLGNKYYYGWGVSQNYEEAVKWYQKAADQGNKDAKAALERLRGKY